MCAKIPFKKHYVCFKKRLCTLLCIILQINHIQLPNPAFPVTYATEIINFLPI